eukprot:jgi/Mesvir1/9676/Mv12159-RA.1
MESSRGAGALQLVGMSVPSKLWKHFKAAAGCGEKSQSGNSRRRSFDLLRPVVDDHGTSDDGNSSSEEDLSFSSAAEALPPEIIVDILSYVNSPQDLCAGSMICRSWRESANCARIWEACARKQANWKLWPLEEQVALLTAGGWKELVRRRHRVDRDVHVGAARHLYIPGSDNILWMALCEEGLVVSSGSVVIYDIFGPLFPLALEDQENRANPENRADQGNEAGQQDQGDGQGSEGNERQRSIDDAIAGAVMDMDINATNPRDLAAVNARVEAMAISASPSPSSHGTTSPATSSASSSIPVLSSHRPVLDSSRAATPLVALLVATTVRPMTSSTSIANNAATMPASSGGAISPPLAISPFSPALAISPAKRVLAEDRVVLTSIVARDSDGRQCVVSAGADAIIRVWDLLSGRLLRTLSGHMGTCCAALRGPILASVSLDGTVRAWDWRKDDVAGAEGGAADARGPGARTDLEGANGGRDSGNVGEDASGRCRWVKNHPTVWCVDTDGEVVATGSKGGSRGRGGGSSVAGAQTPPQQPHSPAAGSAGDAATHGVLAALASGSPASHHHLKMKEVAGQAASGGSWGSRRPPPCGHKGVCTSRHCYGITALVPGDKVVITTSYDASIKVWALNARHYTRGSRVATMRGHGSPVISMDACGWSLATGAKDGSLFLWSLSELRCVRQFVPHTISLAATSTGTVASATPSALTASAYCTASLSSSSLSARAASGSGPAATGPGCYTFSSSSSSSSSSLVPAGGSNGVFLSEGAVAAAGVPVASANGRVGPEPLTWVARRVLGNNGGDHGAADGDGDVGHDLNDAAGARTGLDEGGIGGVAGEGGATNVVGAANGVRSLLLTHGMLICGFESGEVHLWDYGERQIMADVRTVLGMDTPTAAS